MWPREWPGGQIHQQAEESSDAPFTDLPAPFTLGREYVCYNLPNCSLPPGLSHVALRSQSKVPAVEGHPERTALNSRTVPALGHHPQPTGQADASSHVAFPACTAPRTNRPDRRGVDGAGGSSLSWRLLFLHLAESKWNSHLYLPVIHCIVFPPSQ